MTPKGCSSRLYAITTRCCSACINICTAAKDANWLKAASAAVTIPDEEYLVPLGKGDIKKHGRDITIVANGLMLHRSLNVAEALEGAGISAEVIDPRCLVPFDTELVIDSVVKTSRIVIVEEGNERGRLGRAIGC